MVRISLIHAKNNRLRADGTAQVLIEAYESRERKYYSTGIYLPPSDWSGSEMVKQTNPQALQYNELLRKLIADIEAYKFERLQARKSFTMEDFDLWFKLRSDAQVQQSSANFVQYMAAELETDKSISANTARRYRVTLNYLREYSPLLTFEQLTYQYVKAFDNHLRGTKQLHANTVHNVHKVMKRFIKTAIASGIAPRDLNPYRDFTSKTVAFTRDRITTEQLAAIEKLSFSGQMELENVRDMFVFACYTGLRYEDLQALTHKNMVIDNDVTYLKLIMQKTDTALALPISLLFAGKPHKLLKEKITQRDHARIFGKITNQAANRLLKAIAAMAQVEQNISFHMARHTFCSMLAEITGNAFLIKSYAGHSDIKTSMIYIHNSPEANNRALRQINWD